MRGGCGTKVLVAFRACQGSTVVGMAQCLRFSTSANASAANRQSSAPKALAPPAALSALRCAANTFLSLCCCCRSLTIEQQQYPRSHQGCKQHHHLTRHTAIPQQPATMTAAALDVAFAKRRHHRTLQISSSTRGHSPLRQGAFLKHLAQPPHHAAQENHTRGTHRSCVRALSQRAAQYSRIIATSHGSPRAAPSPPSIPSLLITGASIISLAAASLASIMYITASHHTR